jgi:hypothetical protein
VTTADLRMRVNAGQRLSFYALYRLLDVVEAVDKLRDLDRGTSAHSAALHDLFVAYSRFEAM